jgi:methionyl-tRNA formyltransferase
MVALRVVFMGSPAFTVPVLEAVLSLRLPEPVRMVGVYTAPDRASGRGRRLAASPVKEFAVSRGLPVLSPPRVTPSEEQQRFADLGADLVVLAAYGLLLPSAFLFGPRHGAVNVHPSLLPRHRGATPVPAAILAGDGETGTSIIVMDEGLDTGAILAQQRVALAGTERTPELTDRLFRLGATMLADCLPPYVAGERAPMPQPDDGATMAKRFSKEDGTIDWAQPAHVLERRVRALDPWPGTATTWEGKRLQVLDAAVGRHAPGAPGAVSRSGDGVVVSTGVGALLLRRVRLEGRSTVSAEEFVRGRPAFAGASLPS